MDKEDRPHVDSSQSPEPSHFQENDPHAGHTPQPTAKWKKRLDKLSRWRIDSAAIEFSSGSREFRGGNATVTQATLLPTRRNDNTTNQGQENGTSASGNRIPKKKLVAVKKLQSPANADFESKLRVLTKEMEILAEVSHPNIVRVEGFVGDAAKDIVCLIFPWEENGNVRERESGISPSES